MSTSVLDPTIPEDPGRVRAMLELSGWSLRPTFDGQGNTVSVNVTYVIQIDIRGNLPSSVVKSMTTSMTSAVSRLNHFINKSGYPPFASHISGTRLLDTFDPKTGFYELCYKATPGWTEVRIGRKVYKDGYDFFVKPDDPSVKVEMAPDFGGVRVWTTADHEGQSIIAQVSRKGQHSIAPETEQKEEVEAEAEAKAKVETKEQVPANRKRSASSSTTPSRPDSQVSVASKSSEKSRPRGRASRALPPIPAGTLPPPLPRRSSSLTRYSIPIAPYLAGADAPPMPANTSAAIASATEATASRPISTAESLSSPTLGFFHVPVAAPTTPLTPIPVESISTIISDTMLLKPEAALTTAAASHLAVETALTVGDKHEKGTESTLLSLNSQVSPASTPMPSPMGAFHPMSSLKNNGSTTSLTKKKDVRVTFSLDTIDNSISEDTPIKSSAPLETLMRRNSGSSIRSVESDNGPTLAKEHTVRIVPVQEHHHTALVAEELHSSDCDSDDAEFVEARDELSDDEMEFAWVLTTASAWPSSIRSIKSEQVAEGVSMLFERGFDMLRAGAAVEAKVAIVFLLLVYYAGRLASILA